NPRGIMPGRLPVPLSEAGKKRAEELQEFFSDKNIAKIYSSTVRRCKETAEIVAGGKIPIIFDQRLLETQSAYQGFWTTDWQEFFSHRDELGGENMQDILTRIAPFWDEVAKNTKENILICSHGDPLAVLYAYIHGLELPSETEIPEEGEEVSKIKGWLEKGEWVEVRVWNSHLAPPPQPQSTPRQSVG
ncbi:MAG: histidine phosphatase family protein, partial [Candidatus Pacebacteria bacterium]|nr:histidine phosphatase family protein [Candidatus Paceibacterota bacterium]